MADPGGTGAYANASGDATFTDTSDETDGFNETDMMIRLSQWASCAEAYEGGAKNSKGRLSGSRKERPDP